MSSIKPTSVNVVAWFYMILGSLSVLSAMGYLFVHFSQPENSPGAFRGFIQILIAGSLVVSGKFFLSGSNTMRKVLEIATYALALGVVFFCVNLWLEFDSSSVLIMGVVYLIPLFFVGKALRSSTVKKYVGAEET